MGITFGETGKRQLWMALGAHFPPLSSSLAEGQLSYLWKDKVFGGLQKRLFLDDLGCAQM